MQAGLVGTITNRVRQNRSPQYGLATICSVPTATTIKAAATKQQNHKYNYHNWVMESSYRWITILLSTRSEFLWFHRATISKPRYETYLPQNTVARFGRLFVTAKMAATHNLQSTKTGLLIGSSREQRVRKLARNNPKVISSTWN